MAWTPSAWHLCYYNAIFTFLIYTNLTDALASPKDALLWTQAPPRGHDWHTNTTSFFSYSQSSRAKNESSATRTTSNLTDYVFLQPQALTECLQHGRSVHVFAMSGDIHIRDNGTFSSTGNYSAVDANEQPDVSLKQSVNNDSRSDVRLRRKCLVELSVPASLVLKLSPEPCSGINLRAYELRADKDNARELSRSSEHSRSAINTPVFEFHGEGNGTARAGEETRTLLTEGCDAWYPPPHVFSETPTVWLALEDSRTDTRTKLTFRLRFAAVNASEAAQLQLQVIRTSPTTGYVQTPDWDGRTKQYSPLMRTCVTLTSPQGHVIFISFVRLNVIGKRCFDDDIDDDSQWLKELVGTCSRGLSLNKKYCSPFPRTPLQHTSRQSSTSLSLYFVSNKKTEPDSFGFKAHYSFHKLNAVIKRVRTSPLIRLWNCSTKHWPEFVQHFPCDLVSQCIKGEDELHCPYTGSRCGVGKFEVGGRCYVYLKLKINENNWNSASLKCQRRGAKLASLETQQEWNDVINLLFRHSNFYFAHIGLKTPESVLPSIYRNALQWESGVISYHTDIKGAGPLPLCAGIASPFFQRRHRSSYMLYAMTCNRNEKATTNYLCELSPPDDFSSDSPSQRPPIMVPSVTSRRTSTSGSAVQLVTCPQGHLSFKFAACAADSACWITSPASGVCKAPVTPLPPSFECADGLGTVPYTFVCDFRQDCLDSSDENFCDFPSCQGNMLPCGDSGQCFARSKLCNLRKDCTSGADEVCCNMKRLTVFHVATPPPPTLVVYTERSKIELRSLSSPNCPAAHFKCDGNCLPIFVRCNGVVDCSGQEDEAGCDSYACPGFYRCRGSRVCVDVDDLCNDMARCPQQDDELLCGLPCPDTCTCYGLSFFCHHKFPAEEHPSILFLEARGTGLSLNQVTNNMYLVHLGLADCGVGELSLIQLTRLHSLDLRENNLKVVDMRYLQKLRHLKKLFLAGNPLTVFTLRDVSSLVYVSRSLYELDLSRTSLKSLNESTASALTNLKILNFSHSSLNTLDGFESLVNLQFLHLEGSHVDKFEPDVLHGMHDLSWVSSDNPKLCCSATLPKGFNLNRCFAPVDEISSCDALLRSAVYRVALAMFAVLTLFGNLFCFLYRMCLPTSVRKLGFNAFVTQLCLSDFLMGVYLAVIGVADRAYLGSYLWKDVAWKSSAACKMAGFFSLLSSETSAMIVCLITVERFIVIRFPFSRVHFIGRSAYAASAVSWLIGLVLASVPLLPTTRHWKFYSQTGICIPLPITRKDFPGHSYSFGVMIVCNLGLFVLIAVGQALIYLSVQANTMTSVTDSSSKAKDARIARRLLTVVMSDFMCWFPLGLCGVLSSNGYPVPGEVNVAMAIFVLPLNSALNPFLYTLNLVLEKQQKVQEERIKKFLLSKLKSDDLTKT